MTKEVVACDVSPVTMCFWKYHELNWIYLIMFQKVGRSRRRSSSDSYSYKFGRRLVDNLLPRKVPSNYLIPPPPIEKSIYTSWLPNSINWHFSSCVCICICFWFMTNIKISKVKNMKNTAGPLNCININHLESVKAPSEKFLGVKTDKHCPARSRWPSKNVKKL